MCSDMYVISTMYVGRYAIYITVHVNIISTFCKYGFLIQRYR